MEVLQKASSACCVHIINDKGKTVFQGDTANPSWVDNKMTSSSEENALGNLENLFKNIQKGYTLRITSTLEPWHWIWGDHIKPLLEDLNKIGAKLSVVSCRKSDPDYFTCKAHESVFKNQKQGGHTVARVEMREDQPRYREVHELVDAKGKCNLFNLTREWDSNSFGNAKDLEGVQLLVQEAAKNGLGANVLFCPAKDVFECLAELIATQPLLKRTLKGIATAEEWVEIKANMQVWEKNLQNCNAGANYILFYSNTSVTVEVLFDELSKETYNCVGMNNIRQSLEKRLNAGGDKDIVVAVNSGETTKGERPGDHIDNKMSGNPLARLVALAFNTLQPESVTMENSVRTGWTSKECNLNSVDAAKKRLLVEALFNILLGTQQAPSDEWHKEVRAKGVFVLGTNVISGGASERDPLRAASQMQSGEQGEMTLSELRIKPHLVVAVEYLIDRLGTLKVLTPVTREDALKMTAKQAYSMYMQENGKLYIFFQSLFV